MDILGRTRNNEKVYLNKDAATSGLYRHFSKVDHYDACSLWCVYVARDSQDIQNRIYHATLAGLSIGELYRQHDNLRRHGMLLSLKETS